MRGKITSTSTLISQVCGKRSVIGRSNHDMSRLYHYISRHFTSFSCRCTLRVRVKIGSPSIDR
jgi:hypothetical protein